MIVTASTKLSDLILRNHNLVPVINRFGIQLGFGDHNIETICQLHQVNIHFFLEIVNSFLDQNYFPQKNLQSFPARLIVEYLSKSHRYYLEVKIPKIEQLIEQLQWNADQKDTHISLLKKFFEQYKKEVTEHIEEEELTAYPYALLIEQALGTGGISANLRNKMENYSISVYADSHDDIEEKLLDLKHIIIKYLPPPTTANSYFEVLAELFKLENDLADHSLIEEKVLMPKVREMESKLKQL
ncbi:MAG TPA: hypothetical protein DCQ31_07885 [Bacteroidales bacterium]|nr:hypothetical protein [Bacteroidales bacterium]